MELCVVLKNKERQAWSDVLAVMRLEPDFVLLHKDGTETVCPILAVKNIRLV